MALQSPWGYDGLAYSGQEMRLHTAALTAGRGGASTTTDLLATPQGSPNNTVSVAAGTGIIPATFAGDLGSYEVPNDAALTSPAFAATAANGRWDLLILQVTAGVPALVVVQGTASGSPAYPSLAGLTNYIVICGVKMPANKSIIDNGVNGTIEDRRSLWPSYVIATTLSQVPIPFDGQMVEETASERVWIWDAGNSQWAPSRLLINTAAALPAAPKAGTPAYVTDATLPTGSVAPQVSGRPVTPGLYVFDARWDPPWNLPWGIMGVTEIAVDKLIANSSAEFDPTFAVVFTAVANRRLRVTLSGRGIQSSAAGDVIDIYVKMNTVEFMRTTATLPSANTTEPLSIMRTRTPAAGTATFAVFITRNFGSGTGGFIASATDPTTLLVEDIGPNGQPA